MNHEMTVETIIKDKDGKVISKKESAITEIHLNHDVDYRGGLLTTIRTQTLNKIDEESYFKHNEEFNIFVNDSRSYRLYLDDIRMPKNNDFVVARDFESFKTIVKRFGIPSYISFDHDLGEKETGYDCVKWMCNYMLDKGLKFPENFDFNVHSANPIGAINIRYYLKNFIKMLKK